MKNIYITMISGRSNPVELLRNAVSYSKGKQFDAQQALIAYTIPAGTVERREWGIGVQGTDDA